MIKYLKQSLKNKFLQYTKLLVENFDLRPKGVERLTVMALPYEPVRFGDFEFSLLGIDGTHTSYSGFMRWAEDLNVNAYVIAQGTIYTNSSRYYKQRGSNVAFRSFSLTHNVTAYTPILNIGILPVDAGSGLDIRLFITNGINKRKEYIHVTMMWSYWTDYIIYNFEKRVETT